uniref:Uncharacterized protein n=1 Tax=Strigamia maritima TaxID=126957 RepID=T1J9L1_STRMM
MLCLKPKLKYIRLIKISIFCRFKFKWSKPDDPLSTPPPPFNLTLFQRFVVYSSAAGLFTVFGAWIHSAQMIASFMSVVRDPNDPLKKSIFFKRYRDPETVKRLNKKGKGHEKKRRRKL